VLAGSLVFGAGLTWVVVAIHTLIQTRTPPHLVGRTASATEVVVAMPQTLSIGLGALAVARVDYRLLLVAMVVVLAGCGASLLRHRVDDELPAALPEPVLTPAGLALSAHGSPTTGEQVPDRST
jgi:uncharacterized membrane protein YfcA